MLGKIKDKFQITLFIGCEIWVIQFYKERIISFNFFLNNIMKYVLNFIDGITKGSKVTIGLGDQGWYYLYTDIFKKCLRFLD